MKGSKMLRRLALSLSLTVAMASSAWAIGIPSTIIPPPDNPAAPTPDGTPAPSEPTPTSQGETPAPPPPNPGGTGGEPIDDVPPPPDNNQAPEPASLLTAGIGLGIGGLYKWRNRRRKDS